MASVAEQLARMAFAEGAHHVVRHDSLLFSEDEAARMDHETVRALSANGFEQLRAQNAQLAQYASIFAPTSRDVNRMMLTKQENDALSTKLAGLLTALSPHFALPATHKALEWLVRRYQINKFNVQDVLRCFLPYHAMKMFVRMVQILDIKEIDATWGWLKPIQKSGITIERSIIVHRAAADRGLLDFVARLVSDANPVAPLSPQTTNFFLSIVSGVLETKSTESLVQSLLPALVSCLKSSDSDLRSAGYVILCIVANKKLLEESLAQSLFTLVARGLRAPTVSQGLAALNFIAHTQLGVTLDQESLQAILSVPTAIVDLATLSADKNTHSFVLTLLRALISADDQPATVSTLLSILDSVKLDQTTVNALVYCSFCLPTLL